MIATELSDEFDITIPAIKSSSDTPSWDQFINDECSSVLNIEDYLVAVKLVLED